ncbi:MAG: ZIP family metal transporter [Candidatus Sedimenticola endophacoides]|nr:MAG: ZIP family metal transporter [Candidatus Sedimenticola endophacoides]PUE05579.1 MAG: ZIP family metal transporter [Candidatus Sedimenticola endophacoides]
MNLVWTGFLASLGAGLLTGVGALGVYFVSRLSPRLEDGLLSFAAGIMLAASFFSLILPAIAYGEAQVGDRPVAVLIVIVGILCGALVLSVLHRLLPHEHFFAGHEGPESAALGRIWLFVIAITMHNFPEGMAVGVGFSGGDIAKGLSLATGIGIQNIPEGLAVSLSLMAVGYSRAKAVGYGFLTGLAEPLGGLFGAIAGSLAGPLMPWTLAFAAGAMLFVISDEIIPETHRRGYETQATFSLLAGFVFR